MKILAVTSRRVKKLKEPIQELSNDSYCLAVEDRNRWDRYLTIFSLGTKYIRQNNPDVLLVDGGDITGFITLILGKRYRLPVVIRLGGDPWKVRSQKRSDQLKTGNYISYVFLVVLSFVNSILYKLADGFIVVSEDLEQVVLQKTSSKKSTVQVVPPHVNMSSFSDSKTFDEKSSQEITLLTVTNLRYEGKYDGVLDTIKELKPILERRDDIRYIIAGGGMYLECLIEWLNENSPSSNIRNQIQVLGYVNDVEELYEKADVFLYVSYIDGYPNVILEAQASSLPIVANADHGIPMQIEDGKTGYLIEPSQEGDLRSQVEYLLNDLDEAENIGDQALKRVQHENSVEVVAKKLISALKDINKN